MYLDLVIVRRFLFKTGRSPIPSSGQHDERAITEATGVPHRIVYVGVRAGSRYNSALIGCCASLLRICLVRLWLRLELGQYAGLLLGKIGRRRAPLTARHETKH